ncbi:MAG: hypothetical protein HC804_15040 [Anaerolineae bacterium]|nr:hypothetical protein [Anaerolineae bacterium]
MAANAGNVSIDDYYTLLDPLAIGAGDLLIAIGRPDLPFRTKIFQIVIFIPAVILLGNWLGIEGVALAANLMVGLGALILFRLTHRFVDYSARRLWLWPTLGLVITCAVVLWLNSYWVLISPWLALLGKFGLICVIYGGLLFIAEREDIKRSYQMVRHWLRPLLVEMKLGNKR